MKKVLILIFITAPLLFSETIDQDRDLGKLFARYAWDAYAAEQWEGFEDLTDKGLEYDSQNPDLLAFKGLIQERKENYLDAGSWFSKAYYCGILPDQMKPAEILANLFELNYRLGRYDGIEAIYHSLNNVDDPDILFYTVLAFRELKKTEDAIRLAEDGLYRYQDQRFLIFLASQIDRYISVLSEYIERQGLLYPDFLARLLLENEPETDLLMLYLQQYNDMNSWYFRTRFLDLPPQEVLMTFEGDRIWSLEVLVHYVQERGYSPDKILNLAPLAIDCGSDGIADLYIDRRSDSVSWRYDPGQDGNMDKTLYWDGSGVLQSLELADDSGTKHIQFYDYPFVDRVLLSGKDRNRREYKYLPGSYSHDLGDERTDLVFDLLASSSEPVDTFLSESELLEGCFSLLDSVVEPELRLFREYSVVNGMIKKFREDSNFDGFFDRIVYLEQWLPYEGFRDVDNDGEFDLKEKYLGGRFAAFQFEGENSRMEEYQDYWNKQRYQLWDFSKDNFYDARLLRREDGSWVSTFLEGNTP